MAKHIGIAGCSIDGAALCYRTLCLEAAAGGERHAHQEISVHNMAWTDYLEYVNKPDWKGIARLMLTSARKLAKAGAELIICPDNTFHQVFDEVATKSPVPWLHIADVVAEEAFARGYRRLGLLGTKLLMNGPVYRDVLARYGMQVEIPEPADQEKLDGIIFEELNKDIFSAESRRCLQQIIDRLKLHGCDAVILGCTELPLLITPEAGSLPALDSTRLLARGALRASLESITTRVFRPHLSLYGAIRLGGVL